MTYNYISLNKILQKINTNEVVLPAIQREFVWQQKQTLDLFDSLMKDYPIGTFLFWNVEHYNQPEIEFYEFVKNFHEDEKTIKKVDITKEKTKWAVLDGQQRLTALYIGFKGKYVVRRKGLKKEKNKLYDNKYLYLNLILKSDDPLRDFNFQFLRIDEAINDKNNHWFKVSDIFNFKDLSDVNEYLRQNKLLHTSTKKKSQQTKYSTQALSKLYSIIDNKGENINYYEECPPDDQKQDIDKIFKIFVRANTGGTVLKYSDLLLSMVTTKWNKMDARSEIVDFVEEINDIGTGYNFDKDFVLKACLMLTNLNVEFNAKNFNTENMLEIERNWAPSEENESNKGKQKKLIKNKSNIKNSVQLAIELVKEFGYTEKNLPQHLPILPIAYYIHINNFDEKYLNSTKFDKDKEFIRQWFIASILKLLFSKHPDYALTTTREIIKNNKGSFPLEKIVNAFKGISRSLIFSEENLEEVLSYRYGQKYTFSTLAMAYPDFDFNNIYHMDHIHPKSLARKAKISREKYDAISNLQFLPDVINKEKSKIPFKQWLYAKYPQPDKREIFLERQHIPNGINLDIKNLKNFSDKRKVELKNVIKNRMPLFITKKIIYKSKNSIMK